MILPGLAQAISSGSPGLTYMNAVVLILFLGVQL